MMNSGRPRRVGDRAADDRHRFHALRFHVLRGELAHLAGAEDDHVSAGEVAEDLPREGDGGEADRDGARPEVRFGAHALADGETRVEEAVEQRSGGFRLARGAVGFFHLTENLRFADDERVEAGGDAKQMPRGFQIGDVVHVRLDGGGVHVVERADERHEFGFRRRHVVARHVELGAVAGREHGDFAAGAARVAGGERAERELDAARLEVDAFADFNRRGAV